VWKPYIIYEKLSQINHGDVLVYLDAGCHINSGGLQRYNDYEQIVLNSETGMLAVQTEHLEKHYTNSKVLEYFKVDNNQDILNSGIIQATIIIIHKKKQSQSIIKAWLDVVVEDYRLFTDDYNEYKKKEYFIDHRHDQSSFSILMKLKKGETIPDETWVSSNWESIHDIPFQARRLEQKMKTESEKILQAVLLNQEDWLRAWQIALKAKVDGDIKLVDKACNIVLKVRPQFWFARELPMHARGFYSQMDQDKLIEWYFQECPPQNKVFLEIGAFDGVHYSNVRRLHEKHGWTGISVEPVQKNFNKLARSYENTSVQCVRAAVGTESGEIEINVSTYPHLPEWGSDVATLRESEMSRWKQYGAIWNQEKVALKTLTSIINESHFDDIDFLSIDTEGYDLEVLKSLDWGRFNPSLIIVEYGKQRDEILNFLTGLEYSLLLDNKQDLFLANVKRSCESRKPQKDSLVDQSAIGEDIINRLKELKELATNSTVSHPKHSKIVGLIAARNEQVFIKTCLLGLARYTDAIVYLDDASDDDTLRIVESLAQECRIEKIIRKQKWHRDEPGDRNAMLLAGREIGGTHFISLDADELFTSNCLDNNFLREQIFKLQPGDKILLNWIQLWRGINQYRFDDSVWTWNYKGFIFCDDGKCSYSSAFIHTPRIPKNLSGNSKRIEGYDYGVMHFQFVNWRNLLVKQSWYRCLERIRDPQKPVTEINRLYAPSKDETNLGVSDSPYKWFSGYEFFDPSIYNLLEQWREKQILQWFAEYSWEYFAELDVWDIDWGKGDDNFQSIVLNKSTITMSTLGKMGRFGNQIFEYAFLKIYAEQHNLNVETPSWIGQYLFGHKDPPISQQLPKFKERIDRVELSLSRVLNSPTPLKNVDLWGYFQYHTSYYAQHKNYFCSLFQPVLSIEKKVRKGWEKLQAQGKTIIGIHLRRTDAGSGPYYITPSDRYKEWLAEFWETLNEPVLFIASDELDAVINDFQEYEPITVKDLDIELPKSDFYPDFYILSCCDIVAISNSSFSFAACMLNNQAKLFFRPSLVSHKLIPFDPWDSDVLLHEKKLKLPDKGYKAQITTKDFLSVFVGDTMKIVAKVKNISSVPWQASYISHIFLSGYWLDGKINLAKLSEFQARFHKEIKPGEATEVSFKIDAPSLPGQFVLELDLLDEDITWFKDKGSETFRVQVSVAKNTGSLTNAALYKVSAIVSTYNSEKFIRGCLQDLVEQTLYQKGELEIVIIDNTSEQNERGIVEEFQSKYSHIVYHRTPQRETLYASWNRGIKTSRGEYITNANTDDRHRLDALEIMANYLDANSEASVVYADQLITYTPNETWSTTKATKKFNWPEFSYSELQKRYIIGPQIMWRKSLHEKYGYFRDRYKSSGDYEFWLRVGRTENLVRLPETLGIYYWKPEGLSTAPESARSV
jgi:FkbM family methyltransferase